MSKQKKENTSFSFTLFIYSIALFALLPFALLHLWLRGRKLPAYRERWRERFGVLPPTHFNKPVVWFHTASVGEFIAAKPLIAKLLARGDHGIVVTTTTPTAAKQVSDTFGAAVFHCYQAYDLGIFVKRFLKTIQPTIALILETELWPNTLAACKQHDLPVLLLNARLSKQSAAQYRKIFPLFSSIAGCINHIAAQSESDAERFIALGCNSDTVRATGNIKFDIEIDNSLRQRAETLKNTLNEKSKRQIIIAASTHTLEEDIILDAFAKIRIDHPTCLLLLAPRHPDRFGDVFTLCRTKGFQVTKKSANANTTLTDEILLCDTIGELIYLYGVADIAIVGGSFIENGGHNYIEPAAWGIPIFSGPSTFNFSHISELLLTAGALKIAHNSAELAKGVSQLLDDEHKRVNSGRAGLHVTAANRGATEQTLALIDHWLTR